MKKDIHSKLNDVQFICAACNSTFNIKSSLNEKTHNLDVCCNCHPFYVGKTSTLQAKGRAEQFSKKIAMQSSKPIVEKKESNKKTETKSNKKIIKSLSSL